MSSGKCGGWRWCAAHEYATPSSSSRKTRRSRGRRKRHGLHQEVVLQAQGSSLCPCNSRQRREACHLGPLAAGPRDVQPRLGSLLFPPGCVVRPARSVFYASMFPRNQLIFRVSIQSVKSYLPRKCINFLLLPGFMAPQQQQHRRQQQKRKFFAAGCCCSSSS